MVHDVLGGFGLVVSDDLAGTIGAEKTGPVGAGLENAVRDHQHLKCIPVVVLTTSNDEEDVLRAYGLCANCYITKPVDLDQFLTVVKSIETFWLAVVTLAPK